MNAISSSAGSAHRAGRFGFRNAKSNCMLQKLSDDETSRMSPDFETVCMRVDSVVFEENEPARHAYFPLDSVISLQCTTREGISVEFGMVGSEGALGVEALLESGRLPGRAVVVRAGYALRIPERALLTAFRHCTPFRTGLLFSYGAFNSQVVQRSICHRVHTVEQQFCTWLLLMHDRSESDRLDVTHEEIGGLLGGRREGVSLVVRRLRCEGLIGSGYRSLQVLNRAGLEERSCECYAAIRGAYACLHCPERPALHLARTPATARPWSPGSPGSHTATEVSTG